MNTGRDWKNNPILNSRPNVAFSKNLNYNDTIAINMLAQPLLLKYFIMYIIKLTKTRALAHHFMLIGITYNGKIS
jgi:hypothetical protein